MGAMGEGGMVAHLCCLGYCFAKYLYLDKVRSDVRVEHKEDKAWYRVNKYFDVAVGGVQRD